MNHPDVDEAIRNVQELKLHLIDRQLFRGYSGIARIVGGCVTLCAAAVMSRSSFPPYWPYHMAGWALVYIIAVLLNGGALFTRFLRTSRGLRDWTKLRPVWDAVPPLVAAGVLTLHLTQHDLFNSLFGVWMLMYGLIHLCSRHYLPRFTEHVGWYYLLCGTYFLLFPPQVLNPWPLGIVFFIGELAGGLVFYYNRSQDNAQ